MWINHVHIHLEVINQYRQRQLIISNLILECTYYKLQCIMSVPYALFLKEHIPNYDSHFLCIILHLTLKQKYSKIFSFT